MRAAVYDKCGAPGVLDYRDVPDPVSASVDVLIDVEAISLKAAICSIGD